MRHVWACRLSFAGSPDQVVPRLRAVVRRHATAPYGGWPDGVDASVAGRWVPDAGNVVLRWRTAAGEGRRVWELSIDEPYGVTALRAVTLAQVGASGGTAFAFLRLSLTAGDNSAIAGPVNLVARPPSMLAAMLDAETATDADERLLPRPFVDAGGVRVARVATHPGRRLPVVCIDTGAVNAGVDAGELAGLLAGLAHVAVAPGGAIAEHLGTALAPPGGGARILWPDVAPGDPEGRHRSFSRPDLIGTTWEGPGRPVARLVFDAASVHLSRPIATAEAEAADARARVEEMKLRSAHEIDAVMAEWEHDLVELGEARRLLDEAESRAREAEGRHAALIDGFHGLVETAVAEQLALGGRGRPPVPTLAVALRRAEARAGELVFLPTAHEAAAGHPFARPNVVFEDLAVLDALAGRWRAGEIGGSLSQEALHAGLPWSGGVSLTARTQFAPAYTFDWNGEAVLAGPHLRYGGGGPPARHCRVYLALHAPTRTVIVCHAGRHLPDSTSSVT